MQLRPHQSKALLPALLAAMREERFALLQAAAGAGETVLFSELIRRCMTQYSMRAGVVAHRKILVRQARDKLRNVWPKRAGIIGMARAACRQNRKRHA